MELSLLQHQSFDHYPRVAVVIPVYNGAADLPDLLQALSRQTYPQKQVRYFLSDNGSGDRTFEQIQSAVGRFQSLGLVLQALSAPQIRSSYAARNVGILAALAQVTEEDAAQGLSPALPWCEIIAFTDVDCRPQPDWLSQLVSPFIDPQVGLVAGEVLPLNDESWLERYAARREFLSQRHTLAHRFLPYGQTANLAVRRSPLEEVGLFRPYLTSGGDADLCWRILQTGRWQIRLAAGAIAHHRHRATLTALWEQWQRYGRSDAHLNALHGAPLMRSLTPKDYGTRLARWLLKETPAVIPPVLRQQEPWDRLLDTPLDLFCAAARAKGQRHSTLPAAARAIAWPPNPEPPAPSAT
ncbi:MAG: hypothetical protein Fur0046_14620 [Cyanobacteria bacterium J069]|nr:MAG: glycosyltransferase [Cyanobacteria bacterium J069]